MMVEVDENWLRELKYKFEQQREEIRQLRRRLDEEEQQNRHLNFRIEQELEPRLKQERDSYDRWVSQDTGAEACECFSSLLDGLIEFVEDPDNEKYMDWEDSNGDLECKILYLIKNKADDDLMYIEYKN